MENEKNQAIMTVVVTAADFLMSPNLLRTNTVTAAVKIIVKAKMAAVILITKYPNPKHKKTAKFIN